MIKFPHCDPRVVHPPSANCKFCNESGLQDIRKLWNINFTGEHDPDKYICPAEAKRPLNKIEKWGGNRPFTSEREAELERTIASLTRIILDKTDDEFCDCGHREHGGCFTSACQIRNCDCPGWHRNKVEY